MNVTPLTIARRSSSRARRPPARPYDWADEHRHTFTLTVSRPAARLVLTALAAIRTTASEELRHDLHRQLAEQTPTTPAS